MADSLRADHGDEVDEKQALRSSTWAHSEDLSGYLDPKKPTFLGLLHMISLSISLYKSLKR